MKFNYGMLFFFLWLISSCSTPQAPILLPTQTLVPPTITPTITPTQPTATPRALTSPLDLVATPNNQTIESLIPSNDLDVELAQILQTDLQENLNIDIDQIQLASVEAVIFTEGSLSCEPQEVISEAILRGFYYVWLVGETIYTHVAVDDERFVLCDDTESVHGELLTLVDPIASEMVTLAKRRVVDELQIQPQDVTLVDIISVTWEDSSLGCPQPDQVVTDVLIEGYRIQLSAEGQDFTYHTDSVRLFPCDTDDS